MRRTAYRLAAAVACVAMAWAANGLSGVQVASRGVAGVPSADPLDQPAVLLADATVLTVDDLIELKQLGFSEAEIKAEVLKSAGRLALSPEDEQKLRLAGFTEEMLTFLRSQRGARPADRLTVDQVVAMVQAGKTVEQVLEAMQQSGLKFQITPAAVVDLAGRDVPAAVIAALRGRPLTLDDVKQLAGGSLTPGAWARLVELVGVAKTPLSPSEALSLIRARVPKEVVTRMREVGPTTAPAGTGPAARAKRKAVWDVAQPARPGVYEHAGKLFTLRYPRDWQLLRVIRDCDPEYMLTPETGPVDPDTVRTGVEVMVWPLGDTSVLQGKDAVSILRHLMPIIQQIQPGLKPVGEIARSKLGALDAATVSLEGTVTDLVGQFTVEATIAQDEGELILVACQAPRQRYDAMRDAFESLKKDSQFGRPRAVRLERALEPQEIVRRFKASVVSIVNEKEGRKQSTGSGFIISRDGYVITNHHVIWDDDADRPYEETYVEWDESLKRKRQRAKVVAYKFKLSEYYHSQHGVDIALLKIDAGDYEPFELTPLRHVEIGDGLVTLGFPSRGLMEGVSLTVTRGVVTRFNRGPDGAVNSILTDAAITHGSSGGPSVSLLTGGVIGLNTFLPTPHVVDPRTTDLNNYFGVVPIDACLREWPLELVLRTRRDGEDLDFFDAFALSRFYGQRESYGAAIALARRAAALRPQSADAVCQVGSCLAWRMSYLAGQEDGAAGAIRLKGQAVRTLTKALALDPEHPEALMTLARVHLESAEYAEATECADRAMKADPTRFRGPYLRAQIAYAEKDYPTAVQYVARAKQLSRNTSPDPLVLSGQIHYAAGQLDAGLDDFVLAARLHPANLEARLGVAGYHELKRDMDAAAGEFKKIIEDFPENPTVLTRLGNCIYRAKRYKEALVHLERAVILNLKLEKRPPEDVLIQIARCIEEVGKDPESPLSMDCLGAYGIYLRYYPTGQHVVAANLNMARIAADRKMPGLATAHLNWAREVSDNKALPDWVRRLKPAPLSVDEIKKAVRYDYPLVVLCRTILNNALAFSVTGDAEVGALVQNLAGVTKEKSTLNAIVSAVLESQRRHRPPGPTTQPTTRPDASQGRQGSQVSQVSLVGMWVARGINDANRKPWVVTFHFKPDGTCTFRATLDDKEMGSLTGAYKVTATRIVGQWQDGDRFSYAYKRQGDTLVVTLPEMGGPVEFTRQKD